MTEQKEVYMVVYLGSGMECPRPHATFYDSVEAAKQIVEQADRETLEGTMLLIQGVILTERVGE